MLVSLPPANLEFNENPYPPLPSVIRAVTEEMVRVNRYPDPSCRHLVSALSARLGVNETGIVTGCGTVSLLKDLVISLTGPGDEVIHAWPSFEAYPQFAGLSGATAVRVPLNHLAEHDLEAMLRAVTPRTRLMIICNPNNPTGTAVAAPALRDFLDQVPPDLTVVLDEAYYEFTVSEPDDLATFLRHPNVIVLRTFSKAFGLAGLRVGYAIGHPDRITPLARMCVPYGVSDLAQTAAIASLAAQDELLERVASIREERDRVAAELLARGWIVPSSQTNFLWLPLGEAARRFARIAATDGVRVKDLSPDGVRVGIGTTQDNDRFLDVVGRHHH